jgi:hypothetical protein
VTLCFVSCKVRSFKFYLHELQGLEGLTFTKAVPMVGVCEQMTGEISRLRHQSQAAWTTGVLSIQGKPLTSPKPDHVRLSNVL